MRKRDALWYKSDHSDPSVATMRIASVIRITRQGNAHTSTHACGGVLLIDSHCGKEGRSGRAEGNRSGRRSPENCASCSASLRPAHSAQHHSRVLGLARVTASHSQMAESMDSDVLSAPCHCCCGNLKFTRLQHWPHCRTVQAASLHVAQAPAAPHAAAQIHRSLLHVAGRLQVSCCMVVACYICHVARVMLHGLLHLATCTQYVASRRAVMLRLTCCASHRTARACYVLLAAHDAPSDSSFACVGAHLGCDRRLKLSRLHTQRAAEHFRLGALHRCSGHCHVMLSVVAYTCHLVWCAAWSRYAMVRFRAPDDQTRATVVSSVQQTTVARRG